MAKHLLQHATFTGAARKKARLLQKETEASCAAAAAAFFSNARPAMMKAEPQERVAAGHDMGFPIPGSIGRHGQQPSSSAGPARRDHGVNNRRISAGSNQKFTTVPYYDGHEWRKYGEKTISGLDFPRCYYRCTYSPCPAKKRVEQVAHDYPPMYLVTYQMEHTCNVSTRGADSAMKAEPVFLPFAREVQESIVVEQKHFPSTPSTITDGSCGETCSQMDRPTLPELSTLESMEMLNFDELTRFLDCSSPDLPILSDLVELESELTSAGIATDRESSIAPTSGYTCPSPDQAHSCDLATLGLVDVAAKYNDLGLAVDDDMHAAEQAPAGFGSSYLDVLDQLKFDDEDALNPLWSW